MRSVRSRLAFGGLGLCVGLLGAATGTVVDQSDDFESYGWGASLAGTNGWSVSSGGSLTAGGGPNLDMAHMVYALETEHRQVAGYRGEATWAVMSDTNAVLWLDLIVESGLGRLSVGNTTEGEFFGLSRLADGALELDASYRTFGLGWQRQFNPNILLGTTITTSTWTRLTFEMNLPVRPTSGSGGSIPAFRIYVNGLVQSNALANLTPTGTGTNGTWFGLKTVPTNGVTRVRATSATTGTGYLDDMLLTTTAPPLTGPPVSPVRLLLIDGEAGEAGLTPAHMSIERADAGTNWLAVSYSTGGSAVFGIDYEALPQVLVIPAFATNANLWVVPRNVMATNVRDVVVTLTSNRYSYGVAPLTQTATIAPDETPTTRRQSGPSTRHAGFTISEIMYHPAPRLDGRDGQFIEIMNTLPVSERLGGYRLSGAIDYTFPPDLRLASGAVIIVAKDPTLFPGRDVFGPFTGSLPLDGGRLRLRNRADAILFDVVYGDHGPWPVAADGTGHSLTLIRPDYGEADGRAWSASSRKGGSPGWRDLYEAHGYEGLVINA